MWIAVRFATPMQPALRASCEASQNTRLLATDSVRNRLPLFLSYSPRFLRRHTSLLFAAVYFVREKAFFGNENPELRNNRARFLCFLAKSLAQIQGNTLTHPLHSEKGIFVFFSLVFSRSFSELFRAFEATPQKTQATQATLHETLEGWQKWFGNAQPSLQSYSTVRRHSRDTATHH